MGERERRTKKTTVFSDIGCPQFMNKFFEEREVHKDRKIEKEKERQGEIDRQTEREERDRDIERQRDRDRFNLGIGRSQIMNKFFEEFPIFSKHFYRS